MALHKAVVGFPVPALYFATFLQHVNINRISTYFSSSSESATKPMGVLPSILVSVTHRRMPVVRGLHLKTNTQQGVLGFLKRKGGSDLPTRCGLHSKHKCRKCQSNLHYQVVKIAKKSATQFATIHLHLLLIGSVILQVE